MTTRQLPDALLGFGIAAYFVVFFGLCAVTNTDPGAIFRWMVNWLIVAPLLVIVAGGALMALWAVVASLFSHRR